MVLNRTEHDRLYRERHRDKVNAYQARWRAANRDKTRRSTLAWRQCNPEYAQTYREANRARLNAAARARAKANPDIRRRKEWRESGFLPTRPMPDACECCGMKPLRRLCADHDHTTKAFRGWICNNCNVGIARLGDSSDGLRLAAAYLERNVVRPS